MVKKLLYYADAAAEAKEHRHGSVVLKARFGGTPEYCIIRLLADFYFKRTGKKAKVRWDHDKGEPVGDFLAFVQKAYEQAFKGDAIPPPNTINAALKPSRAREPQ
jgi:hypothetical protein